MRKVTI
jgi:hypothetical protein